MGVNEKIFSTMFSSRMHTVRNSSRLLRGGAWSQGGLVLGGSGPGGCLVPGGACSWGVWYPSMHCGRPPVNRMTDRCKNITFATSLRTVKIRQSLIIWFHTKQCPFTNVPSLDMGNDFTHLI